MYYNILPNKIETADSTEYSDQSYLKKCVGTRGKVWQVHSSWCMVTLSLHPPGRYKSSSGSQLLKKAFRQSVSFNQIQLKASLKFVGCVDGRDMYKYTEQNER